MITWIYQHTCMAGKSAGPVKMRVSVNQHQRNGGEKSMLDLSSFLAPTCFHARVTLLEFMWKSQSGFI